MIETTSPSTPFIAKPAPIDVALQQEVELFYYWEAKLLNDRRFPEWFALLADDIRYCMPIRTTRVLRESHHEYTGPNDYAHFDEDAVYMRQRLRKITSDVSWSENPASRTRHIISNVMIVDGEHPGEYQVSNVFVVYRNRLERQVDIFAGERQDLLRRTDDDRGFEIARRTILLDQSTVLSNNLSFFF
ncbi:benzene 1,2-dioxygenase [Nocardioides gansuensis]|uniref:Benzene 1,2-dioxygenase n=1 Tax=Nocardioides gansuensis TaxID=2138300 RepID=A0A2T8FBU9_9ACTN|nr:aromatic-ring-hydroxylating dioxygenase subunit beta [Nocardioides gansuensis]PVG83180.1 benzene 1,2-dioxygenase [Nocardioides gansuensis]